MLSLLHSIIVQLWDFGFRSKNRHVKRNALERVIYNKSTGDGTNRIGRLARTVSRRFFSVYLRRAGDRSGIGRKDIDKMPGQ